MQWLIDIVYDAIVAALGHVWDIKDIVPDDQEIIIGDGTIWAGEQFEDALDRYPRFVDRGDPADHDYRTGDLTTDGAWHDMDLSGIVPAGARAVTLRVWLMDNLTAQAFVFRTNGNANAYNAAVVRLQAANTRISQDKIIALDANRVIEYFASNTVWNEYYITVKGWWL